MSDGVDALIDEVERLLVESDKLRAERDAARAAIAKALAVVDDWASDETQVKLVMLPSRISAALGAVPAPEEPRGKCPRCGDGEGLHTSDVCDLCQAAMDSQYGQRPAPEEAGR